MFLDYYKIFGLPKNASKETIKKRYRELAKKYHPDINNSEDATIIMQEILEAYYILNDDEARARFDKIYDQFYKHQQHTKTESERNKKYHQHEWKAESSEFNFDDPILEKWIKNAKNQAFDILNKTYKETKGVTKNGCMYFIYALGINIILFILVMILIGMCN